MSITYTPTTNFGSKDSLPSNDPNKVIKGAEFTTEFTAIQSAFGLAAPSSNPTFTGTATFDSVTADAVSLGDVTTSDLTVSGTSTLGVLNAGTTTVGAFTSVGIDDNATSTAITIDANENVGIGTASPSNKLEVNYSTNGSPYGLKLSSASRQQVDNGLSAFEIVGNLSYGTVFNVQMDGQVQINPNGVEAMRIDNAGNVGIGETNPSKTLDVRRAGGNPEIQIKSDSDRPASLIIDGGSTGANGPNIFGRSSGTLEWLIASSRGITGSGADLSLYTESGNGMRFYTGGANERMRIDSLGNVGIGTGSGAVLAPLHVAGDGYFTNPAGVSQLSVVGGVGSGGAISLGDTVDPNIATLQGSSDAFGKTMAFYSGAGGPKAYLREAGELLINASSLSEIGASANTKLGVSGDATFTANVVAGGTVSAQSHVIASGNAGAFGVVNSSRIEAFDLPGQKLLAFYAGASPVATFYDNQLASFQGPVQAGGNVTVPNSAVRVGTTSALFPQNPSQLDVHHSAANNGITIKNSTYPTVYSHTVQADESYGIYNASVVGVKIPKNGTSWTSFSDENLKENVSDLGPVLDTIKDFRCVNYSLKATESEAADKVGFIAQDWEHSFPNVVSKDEEGTLSMKYTETIPVLLKAMQEQQALIEALTAEVEALKNA